MSCISTEVMFVLEHHALLPTGCSCRGSAVNWDAGSRESFLLIPACLVGAIRLALPEPSDMYVGYKDADTGNGSDSDSDEDDNSEYGFPG